jgi:hypothetical protein
MLDYNDTWSNSKYYIYFLMKKKSSPCLFFFPSMSSDSRQRILNVMGMFRPTFRDVAQALTDIDLILVEESFERLLLDYDRVFSAMAIPACLWRRTGEIYKGNKEFAALINVPYDTLRDASINYVYTTVKITCYNNRANFVFTKSWLKIPL